MSLRESENTRAVQTIKISGSRGPSPEENFLFGEVARIVWPVKTDHALAQIGNVSDRAARDWLAGRVPPPAVVIVAMCVKIVERK